MAYDLLIKNGRIIDGSGRPAFHGDVGVAHGKIVELGRLAGSARRVIEADGRVVSPGFVDNHCHYDAQVLWDPLCTFSCHHGATSVIIGNCSLALAPVKAAERAKLAGMLSYVEAIPMDVLEAGVPWTWETFPEYMSAIGQRLGVNVGTLLGPSALRVYAMGNGRSDTPSPDPRLPLIRTVGAQRRAREEETGRQRVRAVPLCKPGSVGQRLPVRNCQVFRGMPTWLPILQGSDSEKMRAYRAPEVRAKLRAEVDAPLGPDSIFSKRWDLMIVEEPQLPKNRGLEGQSMAEIAKVRGTHPLDAFLDLVVEEELNTVFTLGENNTDTEAVSQILGSPYAVVGLSDGGAHVQFHSNVSNPTRLLGYWVREKKIMSLEHAVRRLTFDSASAFGIYDRGLLQPGMVADLVVFDPDTVRPMPEDVVHDFPSDGWRMRELAEGIHYTVVNGEVLLEKGTHTGSYPGRVLRNARYHAVHRG